MSYFLVKHYAEHGVGFEVTAEIRQEFIRVRSASEVKTLLEWILKYAVDQISCPETGLPLVFLSGWSFGMLSLDRKFSDLNGDAVGQVWTPIAHVLQRWKGNMSPENMLSSIQHVYDCYLRTGFRHITWDSYLNKDPSSIDHPRDAYVNGIIGGKFKGQEEGKRKSKWSNGSDSKTRDIKRLQSLKQVQDYARRFKYRDSVLDLPLREIEILFGTWSQDRVTDDCNYEESCTLIVPGFINIMSAGGIFKTDEQCRMEMKKLGKEDMDIRRFKAEYIQEFLKQMIKFRIRKGLLTDEV